jgi:predicted AlkP superfamily pyrophosphatase or phosphodiesterase
MRRITLICLLVCTIGQNILGRTQDAPPKLIVAITVDQMRYDYLYRYYNKYSENGFKKLINQGVNCKNTHYNYSATQTGPGHAHIFSGSIPALSGIIGNSWFDNSANEKVYVAQDTSVITIGNGSKQAGKMSPKNMLVNTVGDQMRLSNEFKSKVIGIALKDRGAIFPAGHTGMAYWFDGTTGNWISSSYYTQKLPKWVDDFNAELIPDKLLKNKWETLLALNQYTESEEDKQPYENTVLIKNKTTFPYEIDDYAKLLMTPQGNTLTKEFALRTIKAEGLGRNGCPDFLSISFSATDYIGHATGTHSVEIEDTYIRLDKDIEEIISSLEKTIGKDKFIIVLTADHGVADIPAFSQKNKIPAGIFWGGEFIKDIDKITINYYKSGEWVSMLDNNQIYLRPDSVNKYTESITVIFEKFRESLLKREGVLGVINLHDLETLNRLPLKFQTMINNSIYHKRSGDFLVILEPNWIEGYVKGTTHGTMYAYDTHVPLLWYGGKLKKRDIYRLIAVADIAPTIAQFLDILEPNGCIGQPIHELLDN